MDTNYLELINEILSGSLKESEVLEFKEYKFEDGKFNSLDSKNMNTLMKEICSFANTDGGKIILGIAEDENHNPTKTSDTGVNAENFETWEQSFRNKIATKTIPAIYGVKLHHLNVDDNNCILIDIPRSFLKPHAFDDGEHKFYTRNGNESRPMRYPELKNNFLALDSSQRKLSSFRDERISSILNGEVDDSLSTVPSLIIHIYPENSIDPTTYIDLKQYEHNSKIDIFNPSGYHGQPYYNANGLIKVINTYRHPFSTYIQRFPNGVLEIREKYLLTYDVDDDQNLIYYWDKLEEIMAQKIYQYCIELSSALGYNFYIWYTLLNVKGHYSRTSNWGDVSEPLKQNIIKSPIIKWAINESYSRSMLPLFNNFANIFGSRESWLYNDNEPIEEKFNFINKA